MAPDMRSVQDGQHQVRAVFAPDDGPPRRVWLRVDVAADELTCSCRMRHEGQEAFELEHSFVFYRTNCRGLAAMLTACRDVTSSRARRLPLSRDGIVIRTKGRPRVSLTPPRPLDFILHIYSSPHFDVRALLAALKGR